VDGSLGDRVETDGRHNTLCLIEARSENVICCLLLHHLYFDRDGAGVGCVTTLDVNGACTEAPHLGEEEGVRFQASYWVEEHWRLACEGK